MWFGESHLAVTQKEKSFKCTSVVMMVLPLVTWSTIGAAKLNQLKVFLVFAFFLSWDGFTCGNKPPALLFYLNPGEIRTSRPVNNLVKSG